MTEPMPGETIESLQRLAYQLYYTDKLPWATVAEEMDEPMTIVREWAQAYIDRTDAATRDAQPALFDDIP